MLFNSLEFLLYVLEPAVCIADADVDGDHVCIRAAAGKSETERRGEAAKTKDALVRGALVYQ